MFRNKHLCSHPGASLQSWLPEETMVEVLEHPGKGNFAWEGGSDISTAALHLGVWMSQFSGVVLGGAGREQMMKIKMKAM